MEPSGSAAALSSRSRGAAPRDHMWEIMNRAPTYGGQAAVSLGPADQRPLPSYSTISSTLTGSGARPRGGRTYGVSFPPVSSSWSASSDPAMDSKRVRFTAESSGNGEPSYAPPAGAPMQPSGTPSGSSHALPLPSYASSSTPAPPPSSYDPPRPDPTSRVESLERGLAVMMNELSRLRSSVQDVQATAAETKAMSAQESPQQASETAVGLLLRAVKELQERVEGLEERGKTDRDTIGLLVEKLRDSANSNKNLRLAVDEMRASLPLIKHQENDMLLLRREMEHRFLEESVRHVETGKKVDLLLREVSGVGDVLSSRTTELSDGLNRLEDQAAGLADRVQQTEGVIFKAQKREAERMSELSREVAVVLEVVRTTREDSQRFENSLASESELRRQSGKQFLQVVEQLRERVGEAGERSSRDLTDAVGQLNLRISRIYDDVDQLVKEERGGREASMRQLQKDVGGHVAMVEEKVLQLQQALSETRLKQVQLDETFMAATARIDSDLQHAAKSEENARTLMAEELKRMTSEKLSAALDASGRLNRGQHQSVEDLRELVRVEIDSRKKEQKDIRNGIESLARDWMEEFEAFRTEFRRTSNALEVRIDSSEGDVMSQCLEQVASVEEALAARQNLLESVNETHVARLKTLTRLVEEENAAVREAMKKMEAELGEAIDVVKQGHVEMEGRLEHVAGRLGQEIKDDRAAVHVLRKSLESAAKMARQANETLARPGLIPKLETLRTLQEQITRVSTRMEVQEVLGRVTEYLVQGYQSPPRASAATDRTISAHSPARRQLVDDETSAHDRHHRAPPTNHLATSAPAGPLEPPSSPSTVPRTPTRATAATAQAGSGVSPQPPAHAPVLDGSTLSPSGSRDKLTVPPQSPTSKGSKTPLTATTPKQSHPQGA